MDDAVLNTTLQLINNLLFAISMLLMGGFLEREYQLFSKIFGKKKVE
jgi:hypothetical protein